MNEKFAKDFTKGNVDKMLLRFALPFLLAQILQAAYSLADMFIVGRFMGDYGIAAVNNSSVMSMFITALVSGFALSGTVLVAQNIGAGNEKEAREIISALFSLFFYVSLLITVLGLLGTRMLLDFLDTPVEARAEAENYLRICFTGTVFICGYNAVSAVLRGLGDSKRPLYFVTAACLLNVVLDILFVGGFHWGAGGGAFATVLAQGVSFFWAALTLKKEFSIVSFDRHFFQLDLKKIPAILKIGLPSAVQSTVVNFAFLFVISTINQYGLPASTAAGIGGKIDSFAILPTIAISQAVASMAGQNLGAGKEDRAKAAMFSGLRLSFFFSFCIFLLVRAFGGTLIRMFGCTEEAVGIGLLYIRLTTYAYLFNAVTFIVNGLANGSGNTLFAMANAVLNLIITRIPLILLFTKKFGLGLPGVFLAMGLSQGAGMISSFLFYKSGKWRRRLVNPSE